MRALPQSVGRAYTLHNRCKDSFVTDDLENKLLIRELIERWAGELER
jgi:hypothetical protein